MRTLAILTTVLLTALLALLPSVASADTQLLSWTLQAESTHLDFAPPETIVGCDTQVVVNPGSTVYLGYPGVIPQSNPNGGHRTWRVGIFVGWSWHPVRGLLDTGFSTQRFQEWGNDTHDSNSMQYVTVGTRRYHHDYSDGAYDYAYGLKVAEGIEQAWPMIFERGDC